jgi:hypothetical protein
VLCASILILVRPRLSRSGFSDRGTRRERRPASSQ